MGLQCQAQLQRTVMTFLILERKLLTKNGRTVNTSSRAQVERGPSAFLTFFWEYKDAPPESFSWPSSHLSSSDSSLLVVTELFEKLFVNISLDAQEQIHINLDVDSYYQQRLWAESKCALWHFMRQYSVVINATKGSTCFDLDLNVLSQKTNVKVFCSF